MMRLASAPERLIDPAGKRPPNSAPCLRTWFADDSEESVDVCVPLELLRQIGPDGAHAAEVVSRESSYWLGSVQKVGVSRRLHQWQRGGRDRLKQVAESRAERAVVDRTPNLQQQVGASSRPSHLLRLVHPPKTILIVAAQRQPVGSVQKVGVSRRRHHWRRGGRDWLKQVAESRAERAVVDCTPNLQQQVGASS